MEATEAMAVPRRVGQVNCSIMYLHPAEQH
jgi:hypothetical protein